MVEVERTDLAAIAAERVHVAVADAPPVVEVDAQLEGGARLAHELVLVEPEQLVHLDDRRDRRLADPDRADFGRFDQVSLEPALFERLGDRRGRHPAGGPAADDRDLPDRFARALHSVPSCGPAFPAP
jgi:hypothetical protein